MRALVFDIRVNSLYSIRVPFTWQSALTYPVLPPSAVIGLIANALQRYKNDKPPIEYLEEVEEETIWATSRLLTPCIIKSYTTSAITKWADIIGGKFTNALGRQFAYSRNLQIAIIFKNDDLLINTITNALITTPLTCGDSESPVTIEDSVHIKEVEEIITQEVISTEFPVPFVNGIELIEGGGQIYLMHERCLKRDNKYPLRAYIVPLQEVKGILQPTTLKIKGNGIKIYRIKELSKYIVVSKEATTKNRSCRHLV